MAESDIEEIVEDADAEESEEWSYSKVKPHNDDNRLKFL